jgi:hypothetical protein
LLSGFVLDEIDTDLIEQVQQSGIAARAVPSLMPRIQERIRVARRVLEFGLELQAERKA